MFWERIRKLWSGHDAKLADRELRRELAEQGAPGVPHTGGALFDEPFEPTESVPRGDLPDALPDES
ncbi:MAG TPA: hypothetical protein VGI08_05905 [Diaminobutyricibacter sp.]|jgi:hypothetical protein